MIRKSLIILPLLLLLSCKDNFIGDPSKNISTENPSEQAVTLPAEAIGSWYASNGTLTYTISGSSALIYGTTEYAIIKIMLANNIYTVIGRPVGSSLYYAFFFTDITTAAIRAQRSSAYSLAEDAETAAPETYIQYTSTIPSPWIAAGFPALLINSWYTSAGTLMYTISGSSAIQYSGTTYTVIATYLYNNVYKVIGRQGSGLYYAFFFSSLTSKTMSSYRSGGFDSQSGAEDVASLTPTAYTTWSLGVFPSSLNSLWYTSTAGSTVVYDITNSNAVWYNSVTYTVIATYLDGSEYKIIVRSNSSSLYYAFFFIVNSSTNISTYRSASYSSQTDAQQATPGTYTTCYDPWVTSTFPSTLVGSWYTASSGGTLKYTVTNSSGITYDGIYYTTIVIYRNGTAYKIIGKSSSNSYYAFHFNNIAASTLSGYTYCCNQFQSTAERGPIGTMTVYYKH